MSFYRQFRTSSRNCREAIPGQRITKGNSLRATRRPQFCSDKIAWSVARRKAGALLFGRRSLETTPGNGKNSDYQQQKAPGPRKGLQRKAHRKRIGASEDLERKARFLALRAKNAPISSFRLDISREGGLTISVLYIIFLSLF
jgi:hypothetical protein